VRSGRRLAAQTVQSAAKWCACLIMGVLLSAPVIQACDTPVYEYTFQMWGRDPYQVWYYYRDSEDPADAPVNRYLEQASEGADAHINIEFERVNTTDLQSAEGDTPEKTAWTRHLKRPLPFYLILTPRGTELFVGRLSVTDAKHMAQSPKVEELIRQLCEGKQGVLLFLLGSSTQENAAARKVLQAVITKARARGINVGLVEVPRDDSRERWLVRQLLQIEDDLRGIHSPMVFGVFGRAHATAPYIGKGISAENMAELLEFMNGPCACEIKTSSLGMDLLTDFNWQAHVAGRPSVEQRPENSLLFDVAEFADSQQAPAEDTAPQTTGGQGEKTADRSPESTPKEEPGHPKPARREAPATANIKSPPPKEQEDSEADSRTIASSKPAASPVPKPTTPNQPAASCPSTSQPVPTPADSGPQQLDTPPLRSLLALRLGVIVGAVALFVVIGSIALTWRRRER